MSLRAGTRASKTQDGEDVDVLMEPSSGRESMNLETDKNLIKSRFGLSKLNDLKIVSLKLAERKSVEKVFLKKTCEKDSENIYG